MLFNSISFALFLPVVFILYWLVTNKSLLSQNLMLLLASYFFYASWNWKFLILLIFSTALDYYSGLKISAHQSKKWKKIWLWISIVINVGFLGLFKYYNFFAKSFGEAIANFGLHVDPWTIKVILPIGISFYTFHGLSYVIDIYYGKVKPEKNFIVYSLFVSFFPLLVAGPIERATHLLPQIQKKRTFDYAKAVDGLRQILWGLFKKVVIADRCAFYVNTIFNDAGSYSGSTHVLGALFFTFQIYCDFSGYSDIAIGTARLFGIDLIRNFAFPYFSRDIAEFWRRWHISLSSWFRDYLYIPLGGSRASKWVKVRNIFIIFLVSGFWHGANWTFIVWGLLNALYIIPSILFNTHRRNLDVVAKGKTFPSIKEALSVAVTFGLTVFAWIFFRSESVESALRYISKIFSRSLFTKPDIISPHIFLIIFVFLVIFLILEWRGREQQYAIANIGARRSKLFKWAFYYCLVISIFIFARLNQTFIYFQF